jgi:hypothetical protein
MQLGLQKYSILVRHLWVQIFLEYFTLIIYWITLLIDYLSLAREQSNLDRYSLLDESHAQRAISLFSIFRFLGCTDPYYKKPEFEHTSSAGPSRHDFSSSLTDT